MSSRVDATRRPTWTREQIRQARQTPLAPILRQRGYRLEPRPDGNFRLLGLSQDILVKDHYWVCHDDDGTRRGGNSIDFFVAIEQLSFQQTMDLLSS